jgi:hypothetical protein
VCAWRGPRRHINLERNHLPAGTSRAWVTCLDRLWTARGDLGLVEAVGLAS